MKPCLEQLERRELPSGLAGGVTAAAGTFTMDQHNLAALAANPSSTTANEAATAYGVTFGAYQTLLAQVQATKVQAQAVLLASTVAALNDPALVPYALAADVLALQASQQASSTLGSVQPAAGANYDFSALGLGTLPSVASGGG